MLSNEYMAGLFDGEGCIVLTTNGQGRVFLTQKDPAILRLIQVQFGGNIHSKNNGKCYNLSISKKELMLTFLRAIQPYSIIKRNKVEIAIQFIELTQSNNNRIFVDGKLIRQDMTIRNRLRGSFYGQNVA